MKKSVILTLPLLLIAAILCASSARTAEETPAPPAEGGATPPAEEAPALFASDIPEYPMDHFAGVALKLPDDAIVALADFKFTVLEKDHSDRPLDVKCAGEITRFITGTDTEKKLELECRLDGGKFGMPRARVLPDGNEIGPAIPLQKLFSQNAAENCLVIYQRKGDGTIKVLELLEHGLDFAPAYEWLENTKNRKGDRPALAVMVLMDKSAPATLRYLAYWTVMFSNLSIQTRLEILDTASALFDQKQDLSWGLSALCELARAEGISKEDYAAAVRYLLHNFSASKDVGTGRIWLRAIAYVLNNRVTEQYPELCKEIAVTLEPVDVPEYKSDRRVILDRVAPKHPSPEENPAPPAEGGHPGAESGGQPAGNGGAADAAKEVKPAPEFLPLHFPNNLDELKALLMPPVISKYREPIEHFSTPASPDGLALSISLPKQKFNTLDPIVFSFKLANVGNKDFQILGDKKAEQPFLVAIVVRTKDQMQVSGAHETDPVALPAGGKMEGEIEISRLRAVFEYTTAKKDHDRLEPPYLDLPYGWNQAYWRGRDWLQGKYAVRAYYASDPGLLQDFVERLVSGPPEKPVHDNGPLQGGGNRWYGIAESNEIIFEVRASPLAWPWPYRPHETHPEEVTNSPSATHIPETSD